MKKNVIALPLIVVILFLIFCLGCATRDYKKLSGQRVIFLALEDISHDVQFVDTHGEKFVKNFKIEKGKSYPAVSYNPQKDTYFVTIGIVRATSGMSLPYRYSIEIYSDGRIFSKYLYRMFGGEGSRPSFFTEEDMGHKVFERSETETQRKVIQVKHNPDDADGYLELGINNCELGRYKKGIEALKHVTILKPNWARAHYHLGIAYLKSGDKDLALEQYEMLKGLDKNYANKLFSIIYKD